MGTVYTPGQRGLDVESLGLTARRGQVLQGYTYLGADTGNEVGTGAVPSYAARTWTPATADQTLGAGWYLSGPQTFKGDANLIAANIKKGVTIFGVTGTWEGYVLNPNDWYYRGANAGLTGESACVFNTSEITISNPLSYEWTRDLWTTFPQNLTGYTALTVEGSGFSTSQGSLMVGNSAHDEAAVLSSTPSASSSAIVWPFGYGATAYVTIPIKIPATSTVTITRIRLS